MQNSRKSAVRRCSGEGDERLMKKISAFILSCLILLGTVTGFAAPDTVGSGETGDTYDLISVTNPAYQQDSTFETSYVIEGHGLEGTSVMLYWYDSANDVYRKIYDHGQGYDEAGNLVTVYNEAAFTLGASGQFKKSVELYSGLNSLLLYAERDGMRQLVKLNITKYNYNFIDIIKSLTN